jgi:hypothetical protein
MTHSSPSSTAVVSMVLPPTISMFSMSAPPWGSVMAFAAKQGAVVSQNIGASSSHSLLFTWGSLHIITSGQNSTPKATAIPESARAISSNARQAMVAV